MNLQEASREIYWNINHDYIWIMYALLVTAVIICLAGIAWKIREWKKGAKEPDFEGNWPARLWDTFWEIMLQSRVRHRPIPGLFHSVFFWCFLALFIVTMVVFLQADFGLKIYHGVLYIAMTVLGDVAGAILLIGLVIAAVRRFVSRPVYLERRRFDWLLYAGLFYLVLSGFLLEALRIAATGDPWAVYSPVGLALSHAMGPLVGHAGIFHAVLWWSHMSLVAVGIATLPWSRLMHLFTITANVFMRSRGFKSYVRRENVETLMEKEDFTYGLSKTAELTWKQRMDLDACIGCGRCEEVCPVNLAGGTLSPRKFVAALKEALRKNDGFSALPGPGSEVKWSQDAELEENIVWYCRTCYACADACPAMVGHVRFMVELRENKTMMLGEVPADAGRALQSMQTRGNPWGPQLERTEWLSANDVRVLKPGDRTDVLYWLGCCTSYDQTKQRVAVHMVTLMRSAGVDFGILGDEELCCGDPARLLGDESIFQATVKVQLEKLRAVSFKTIVTHCPHCYNVLKNEYRWFGANFDVQHHTDFLYSLIREGRLKPDRPLAMKVTYHDPCYLGRYQGIYDSPRRILRAIPGVELVEMEHCRSGSICCGGGGGHYWMDLKNGKRLNDARVEEANATGAGAIAVACVYCMQMMEDAVKANNLDEKMKVLDIADILAEVTGREAREEK
jgi:Fe-S oxidoreductase/nitrate reductase gamma subunit